MKTGNERLEMMSSSKNETEGGKSRPNSANRPSSAVSPTVLLVDDDLPHRNTIAFDFKRKGFRVLQASSGNEAWAIIQSETVHLVVTDIRMPDGNGVELLSRLRERDPRLPPVILVTGYTELNLEDAKNWGAQAVFCKPFDRKALLAASQEAISTQGVENI